MDEHRQVSSTGRTADELMAIAQRGRAEAETLTDPIQKRGLIAAATFLAQRARAFGWQDPRYGRSPVEPPEAP